MNLNSLLDTITRAAAWAWIRREYISTGPVCPRCGSSITGPKALASFEAYAEKVYCSGCSREFRIKGITPLAGTEWEPEEFVRLLLLDKANVPLPIIATALGKSTRCIRDMIDRLELGMKDAA